MKNHVNKKNLIHIFLIISALILVLLISACKKDEIPTFLPPPEQSPLPPPPPEMMLDVQTNFDIFTPSVPQYPLHTRLHEGAMPELVPSNDYGMLLPYSSAAVMENGSINASKFGLVTIDGIVVTDLIYDDIERAKFIHSWYIGEEHDVLPAYNLSINVMGTETIWGYYYIRKMAACALDGSWVTPFDYMNIMYTKEVILLYRDDSTLDIDVIDYNGNHLYNMLDFRWANDAAADTWSGIYMQIISDRYAYIRIRSNSFAFIDLLTGNLRSTRFIEVGQFIEGFAPAGIGIANTYFVLWGLINTEFQTVVSPRYYSMPFFVHGRAIVQHRDNSQFVINTRGDVLYNVPEGYRLDHSYDGPIFILYSEFDADPRRTYLTSGFEKIIPPEGVAEEFFYLRYLNNGWFTTSYEGRSYLIKGNETYTFPEFDFINYFDGELLIYGAVNQDSHMFEDGVMTLDGKVIVTPETDTLITPVTHGGTTIAFIVGNRTSWYTDEQEYNPDTYRLVDIKGNTIIQGRGILTYHEILGLYSVQSVNSFSWLDKEANPIITIPFLSSTFD